MIRVVTSVPLCPCSGGGGEGEKRGKKRNRNGGEKIEGNKGGNKIGKTDTEVQWVG